MKTSLVEFVFSMRVEAADIYVGLSMIDEIAAYIADAPKRSSM